MLNLIKMYMHKLFTSASTYVLIVILLGFTTLSVFSTGELSKRFEEHPDEYQAYLQELEEYTDDESVGVGYSPSVLKEDITVGSIAKDIYKGMFPCMLLTIFVALFVCSEYSSGFIKNISGQVSNRGKLFLAKLPILFLFNLLLMAVALVTIIATINPFVGVFKLGSSTELIKIFCMQYAASVTLGVFVAAIASMVRSMAISVTLGVCISTGLLGTIVTMLDTLLHKVFDSLSNEFSLRNYTISGNMNNMLPSATSENINRAFIVLAIFFFGSILLAYFNNKRRDV